MIDKNKFIDKRIKSVHRVLDQELAFYTADGEILCLETKGSSIISHVTGLRNLVNHRIVSIDQFLVEENVFELFIRTEKGQFEVQVVGSYGLTESTYNELEVYVKLLRDF